MLMLGVLAWAGNGEAADRAAGITVDLGAVQTFRGGLEQVLRFTDSRPDLFPTSRLSTPRLLTPEQQEEVRSTWRTFLDGSMAMDSVRRTHDKSLLVANRKEREDSFLIAYSAFLAQYRFSLEFIERAGNDPGLEVLLNDPVPELGLEKDSYARFKGLVLNPARGAEYVAFNTVAGSTLGQQALTGTGVAADIEATNREQASPPLITAEAAMERVKQAGSEAWFPVRKGLSIWTGDTAELCQHEGLITQRQIAETARRLLPGDILLERREWYLSNVGLPGFWPHAALFVGTPEERKAFFSDSETVAWVKAQGQADGDFEALLKSRYPAASVQSRQPIEEGCDPRLLEAVGGGVVFSAPEYSMTADSLCVLRPRLTKKERAVALFRAFQYVGRPYDHLFDFKTDSAMVCTELICRAYQEGPDSRGLKFPMLNVLGRLVAPANEWVHQFDATFGTDAQSFDLVMFLDGWEKERMAVEGSLDEFRKSWRRPKWQAATQERQNAEPVAATGPQ